MKKYWMLIFCWIVFLPVMCWNLPLNGTEAFDPAKLSGDDFLKIVRRAPGQESWARMIGTVMHKRSGARMTTAAIRLGIRFTPARIVAQLVVNDCEFYQLGQTFEPPAASVDLVMKDPKATPQLPVYGIDASDLTLGFLYQEVLSEEKSESLKTLSCRVFLLKSNTPNEFTRIWISTSYFFPMKVQWFKTNPEKDPKAEPYRTLEIESVKKENDFWVIPALEMSGKDWRTRIRFEDRAAGFSKDGVPQDLFIEP